MTMNSQKHDKVWFPSLWWIQKEPNSFSVVITPECAGRILETANHDNRRLRQSVVSKYARDMVNGDWCFSPEPLIFSQTGRLLNGQHRLHAVIESDTKQSFMITVGFKDEVFEVIDRGTPRTKADAFRIDTKLVQVANVLANVALHSRSVRSTDADTKKACLILKPHYEKLIEHAPAHAKYFASAAFRLGAIVRLMTTDDEQYVLDLYRDLVLGHTENLPTIGHSVVRGVLIGKLKSMSGSSQSECLSISWTVFDKKSMNRKKLTISKDPEKIKEVVAASGYLKMLSQY
jgi:hypothetical protein